MKSNNVPNPALSNYIATGNAVDMRPEANCPFCGRVAEMGAADYYHEKSCERDFILKKLETETDPRKIGNLRRALAKASYTGD